MVRGTANTYPYNMLELCVCAQYNRPSDGSLTEQNVQVIEDIFEDEKCDVEYVWKLKS